MLAKAVAETLKKHPIMNAMYVEGGIKYNKDVNVMMAVAIDGGLITPTIKKANEQDLFSISRAWSDLVKKAKSKTLKPDEYSSGENEFIIFQFLFKSAAHRFVLNYLCRYFHNFQLGNVRGAAI